MPDFSKWAEHLTNPYALAGFVVLLFFTFIVLVLKKQGRLSKNILLIVFVLSALVVIYVVSKAFPDRGGGAQKVSMPVESADSAVKMPDNSINIMANTSGDKSPVIISNGHVNVRY